MVNYFCLLGMPQGMLELCGRSLKSHHLTSKNVSMLVESRGLSHHQCHGVRGKKKKHRTELYSWDVPYSSTWPEFL